MTELLFCELFGSFGGCRVAERAYLLEDVGQGTAPVENVVGLQVKPPRWYGTSRSLSWRQFLQAADLSMIFEGPYPTRDPRIWGAQSLTSTATR